MYRFLKNTALFFACLLAGFLALFTIPLNQKFAFRFVRGDCYEHGAWLWQRLAENPAPVSVAFAGSSRTLHAVWEKAVEDSLATVYHKPAALLNLGYCRLGNNLNYVIVKILLQQKKPKLLVVEIRETEDRYSHPMFGYVAEAGDVLLPAAGLHRRLLTDWWKASTIRLMDQRARLFGSALWSMPVDTGRYGYGAAERTADPDLLRASKQKNQNKRAEDESIPDFPRIYLEKTLELARQNGVQIAFLYLPGFGAPGNKPAQMHWFEQHGPVWLPPPELLHDPANWMDESHLNDRGAARLAGWLAGKLNDG